MGIFSNKSKKKIIAIFDINSSSVSGALVLIPSKSNAKTILDDRKTIVPEILYTSKASINFQKTFDFSRFLESMLSSLEHVAFDLQKSGLSAPKEIFCSLASPWYASQTRIIKLKKNTPFVFNHKLAGKLIKKELEAFEDLHLKKYLNSNNRAVVIENKNIKVALNGYKTENPLYKKAKELEISLFISMSTEQILNSIKASIRKSFHITNIKFSSFLFSSFVVVRDIFINKDDFLLIDIGGEITDVAIIKDDVLLESFSFPLGKNFVIRRILSSIKKSPEEVVSLLKMYLKNELESNFAEQLDKILVKVKKEWLDYFQEALQNISNDLVLPDTIFMTVNDDVEAWFLKIVEEEEFGQYTLTEKQFNVTILGLSSLKNFYHFSSMATPDPFLVLEAIYFNRLSN